MSSMPEVGPLIMDMASQVRAKLKDIKAEHFEIVGIRTGGVWVAKALNKQLEREHPIGELNISFYRDDFTQVGLHPTVSASNLPFSVDNKHILLVDDVLMSGRTVRAAMNELFDYGRPASIVLAVLVDLNQGELPIAADIIGQDLELAPSERIKLNGPDPLSIEIQHLS